MTDRRPVSDYIAAGMTAALEASRQARPYQKTALCRALIAHMPDAAEMLGALLDVESCDPAADDFREYVDALDKAATKYVQAREAEADEHAAADPYDRRYQMQKEATE